MSEARKNMANRDLTPLQGVFERHDNVLCAYLFGSVAAGVDEPLSDLDIAVLLKPGADFERSGIKIEASLCRCLPGSEVDLVVLNEAPPSLSYRILRDGIVIYIMDEKTKENFEVRTIMRYLDFRPVSQAAFDVTRRKIEEHLG